MLPESPGHRPAMSSVRPGTTPKWLKSCLEYILSLIGRGCDQSISDVTEIIPVCNSIVAMVAGLLCHLAYNLRIAWHTVYAMLLSNYKYDIQCMPCSSQIIRKM